MQKANKNILVTGGAGYVGCVLVPELVRRGYNVRVFDSFFFGDNGLENIKDKINIVRGDIRSFPSDVLKNIDAVIHLAGFSNDPTAEANPEANMEINAHGAIRVAEATKKAGIHCFIQASSCSVYYDNSDGDDAMRTEESIIHPQAPYSLSKKIAEEGILSLVDGSGFCPVILRKGTLYGYSPRMRYDLVVNTFCRDAYKNGAIRLNGGGELWRPLTDVKDAAITYIQMLEAPEEKIKGQIFNVVHKNYRISELGLWFCHILASRKQVTLQTHYEDTSARQRSYRVSGEKLKKVLGISPEIGIFPSVHAIWDKFDKEINIDFDNPIYYNIEWMKLGNIR